MRSAVAVKSIATNNESKRMGSIALRSISHRSISVQIVSMLAASAFARGMTRVQRPAQSHRPTLRSVEGLAGPRQLRRLLDAVVSIGSELDLSDSLRRIVEVATDLVDARYGALGVLDESGTRLAEFIAVGIDEDQRAAIGHLPEGHGILGVLIVDPKPLRLPDLTQHPDSFGFPPNHPPMRSFLGTPILVRGKVFGNLYLCDKQGGEVFSDIDEELVTALSRRPQASRSRTPAFMPRVAELALFEDRERIARDLHDTVIQRLFATGLTLQATIRLVERPEVVDRLQTLVEDLDVTVRHIRSVIFELQTARLPGSSTREAVLVLCADATDRSGSIRW